MDIFQHFGHLFAAVGMLASSFLGQHHTAISSQSAKPVVIEQNVTSSDAYTARRSVSDDGYTINMSLSIPKNGGDITGTISGDCSGNITGTYDGQNNGAINGKTDITCSLLFVQIPGSATFTGTFNKDTKTANLQMTFDVDSVQKTEPVALSFN